MLYLGSPGKAPLIAMGVTLVPAARIGGQAPKPILPGVAATLLRMSSCVAALCKFGPNLIVWKTIAFIAPTLPPVPPRLYTITGKSGPPTCDQFVVSPL